MRKDYNDEMLTRVQKVSGFSGDGLYALTGVAYATAFIGKLPTREDLAEYIGISERSLDSLIKKGIQENDELLSKVGGSGARYALAPSELFYTISAELISRGLYFGPDEEEPDQRVFARTFLSTFFFPKDVLTANTFKGYNIVLEYLWQRVIGDQSTVEEFCRVRFDSKSRALKQLKEFYKIMAPYGAEWLTRPDPMMHDGLTWLGTEARNAYRTLLIRRTEAEN